ncbi:MAG: hypothetical protein MUD10_03370 [Candidatus Pacebacteria bacterium]|jgi:spoIIIJ-associated protein|nr:hypothetical protein [Candidatus Paceibacterota bacterium]
MFNFAKNDSAKIKKTAEDLLRKIAPEAEVSVFFPEEGTVCIDVKVDDAQALIGPGSETLLALQHLLRVMLRKGSDQPNRIELDINNFKKKRKEYLKELAVGIANEVALSQKTKILPAMNAYERRVVHMELSLREDIVTESTGNEPERKVVVKPK